MNAPSSVARGMSTAMLAIVGMMFGACADTASKPDASGAVGGAQLVDGRFVNAEPLPEPAGTLVQAGLWVRKVWTTLVPRDGAAARVDFDRQALHGQPSLTWIGHATFLVRMDGVTFLTDPMFSDWAAPMAYTGPRRLVAPGIAIGELPKIDFAVISHDHYDHADEKNVRELAARGVRFIVPLGLGEWVRAAGGDAIELDWWQHVDVAGVRVHCVPAQHTSGRALGDARQRLWSGWYVSGPTHRFYHAGDTGYASSLAEIGRRLGAPSRRGCPHRGLWHAFTGSVLPHHARAGAEAGHGARSRAHRRDALRHLRHLG